MQGIARVSEYRNENYDPIDAGAYAREGGTMRMPQNANEIIRRIFRVANCQQQFVRR